MASLATQFELPGSKPHYNPDVLLKTIHYKIDGLLDFSRQIMYATEIIDLKVVGDKVTKIDLDAIDMEIYEIRSKKLKNKFSYTYDSKKIYIILDQAVKKDTNIDLEIDYSVNNPNFGINFVNPDKYYPKKPFQVWSQGESEGSRFWFPCLDFPKQIATSEILIRVPKNMKAIAAGKLIKSQECRSDSIINKYLGLKNLPEVKKFYQDIAEVQVSNTNYKLFHWKQAKPSPIYLTSLTAGDYHEVKDKLGELEINYYTSKINPINNLKFTGKKTSKMIKFFENKFGVKYPWDKYYQVWVEDFIWGGMENTSNTINTSRALADEKSYPDVNFPEVLVAHELSHQWFGDLVVINHWKDLWLKEGAATYSESLWWEHEYGKQEFDYYRYNEWLEYIEGESYKRPTVTNIYRHVEDLYDRHSYTKAGTIYHMVRNILGDELFTKFTRDFLTTNAHSNVEAIDFIRSIEKVSGKNITPLLDQYLFTSGHPDFEINLDWDEEYKLAKLKVKQKQVEKKDDYKSLFKLDLSVGFGFISKPKGLVGKIEKYKQNQKEITKFETNIKITEPEQTFYFYFPIKPDFINFDSGSNYVKTIELKIDLKNLEAIANYSDDTINRILAIQEIAKKNSAQALKILVKVFNQEKFWGIRKEIILALKKLKLPETFDFLIKSIKDKDSRVRVAIIKSLAEYKTKESFDLVCKIANSEDKNSYLTEAAAINSASRIATSLVSTEKSKKAEKVILEILKNKLKKESGWGELVRSSSISALGNLHNSEEALNILLEYTELGMAKELRYAAIASLGTWGKYQDKGEVERILDKLDELSSESNMFIELMIIQACSQLAYPRSVSICKYIADKSIYGRLQRKAMEAADNLAKKLSEKESQSSLDKKITDLEKENMKLKSKVESIEARLKEKSKSKGKSKK